MFSFIKPNEETDKKENSSTENTLETESAEYHQKFEELYTAKGSYPAKGSLPAEGSRPAEGSTQANQENTESAQQPGSGLFDRLKQGLEKTRNSLNEGFTDFVLGEKEINEDLLDEIETQLLVSDMGVEATMEIIQNLTDMITHLQLNDADALYEALQENMNALLEPVNIPFSVDTSKTPYVILMVGINGAGKTTTIGKLAKKFQHEGYSVMLAAGDTFRAAAVEQLQVWGERNKIPVIAQQTGADSASVIYDAIEAGKARGTDIVIADTAGRLHTQTNLMDELEKVKRVAAKVDATAPHEIMLVVDAGTGQNALSQAEHFNRTVGLTGITITKLDGTAKGGIIFAIAKKLGIPIRFIGVGESIDDLQPFDANKFVDALLNRDDA
jgi:fused signal recognition particle receptor